MIRTLCLLCLLTFLPFVAVADEQEEQQEEQRQQKEPGSGPNPFSDCGIGAAIFPTVPWAAATSNVIWDVGITAVASAISSPETCSAKRVETARLILETLPSLEKDIAVGSGDYLAALNETMDCDPSAQADLAVQLRLAYADVVRREDYADRSRIERAADLYSSVRDVTHALPDTCSVAL